jgi:hypothetical protein
MIYETGETNFTWNQSSKVISLDGIYTSVPTVTATSGAGTNNNINVTTENITTTEFTILLSDKPGSTMTVSYIVFGE